MQSEFCNKQKLPAKVVRVTNVIDATRQTASRRRCHTGDWSDCPGVLKKEKLWPLTLWNLLLLF